MKTFYIPLLASALLAAACGQGAQQFEIDNTKPVTPDNRVIYQKNGASTFRSAPKGTTPQYVNDSRGQVRQVTPVQQAKPIQHRPNPVTTSSSSSSQPSQRESRPSPISRPARPTGSSMPRSPFLRANPSLR